MANLFQDIKIHFTPYDRATFLVLAVKVHIPELRVSSVSQIGAPC